MLANICCLEMAPQSSLLVSAPHSLKIGNSTDTSISVSWLPPKSSVEPITGYKAVATDPQGRQTPCEASNTNVDRMECTFQNLTPCMRYRISIRTCARQHDCGLESSVEGYTQPESESCEFDDTCHDFLIIHPSCFLLP